MTKNIKSTKYIGDLAEDCACKYLAQKKFKVLNRNWRTKYCEIDIVAEKNKVIYFVEVKYRRNDRRGSGLEAVNSKKLKQMTFAANIWLSNHDSAQDAYLAVIGLSGDFPTVDSFVVIN